MKTAGAGLGVSSAVALWLSLAVPAAAQDNPYGWLVPANLEGKTVRSVEVRPPGSAADTVRSLLQVRAGTELRARQVAEDLAEIWSKLRLPALVQPRLLDDDSVAVVFLIRESPIYSRAEFKGLSHFKLAQVNTFLKLPGTTHWTDWSATRQARELEERYRNDGYLHARVEVRTDASKRTVTFVVDEGPRVDVRSVSFRGNRSYPQSVPLDLQENLEGGARLESVPKWLIGEPFSETKLYQDLERLRLFYRRKGFRDARVELVAMDFTPDGEGVDLAFLIEEGPRYRVSEVVVEPIPPPGRDAPYYSAAELRGILQTKAGEFYDRDVINRDVRELEKFYGKRGHPAYRRYGLPQSFAVRGPEEVFDVERQQVKLIFEIIEGSPKVLHDVRITGNVGTKDEVIRRELRILPGERVDMEKLDRAQNSLDALNYFSDPETLLGPQVLLDPVSKDQPDLVDMRVIVREGQTGSLSWGVGVSSDFGVQGTIEFKKRNFDLFRLPSSFGIGTLFSEVADNEAFHGAGQTLDVRFQPGSRRTDFVVTFVEPDLFGQQFDTIGLRVNGFRTRRLWESFIEQSFGGILGLERAFTQNFAVSAAVSHETARIRDIDSNAPTLVYDAEGQTELRGLRLEARYRDLDRFWHPTSGVEARLYYQLYGGFLGGGSDFFLTGLSADAYFPLYEDDYARRHVLRLRQSFDVGDTFDATRDVFPSERLYMGGANQRGFSRNQAGPTQFGEPTGGEARYLATMEYGFPLISTRRSGQLLETEIIRGVVLADLGFLGSSITNDDFGEPRLAVGVGVRITIPGLNLPLAIDLAWPVLFEETDDRRVFYFSLSPR